MTFLVGTLILLSTPVAVGRLQFAGTKNHAKV